MAVEYSIEVYKELEEEFRRSALHRPMRVGRYEAGTELVYDVTEVAGANKARVHQYPKGCFPTKTLRAYWIPAMNG
ncbi:MAG: hypothetical protein HWN70_10270 [Desulfobacterales bacterium]|nr:hypothetical protein [Desulfobacterales bacterium]